jgi:hypothetical protein
MRAISPAMEVPRTREKAIVMQCDETAKNTRNLNYLPGLFLRLKLPAGIITKCEKVWELTSNLVKTNPTSISKAKKKE